jgi:hypothetical protein
MNKRQRKKRDALHFWTRGTGSFTVHGLLNYEKWRKHERRYASLHVKPHATLEAWFPMGTEKKKHT